MLPTPADYGWGPPCRQSELVTFTEHGVRWTVNAHAAVLLRWLVLRWHAEVEPPRLEPAQNWSYACRSKKGGGSGPSVHSWALALDFNSAAHPFGRRGTFAASQIHAIRRILADARVDGLTLLEWGGEWDTPDEMHVEVVGSPAAVSRWSYRKVEAMLDDEDRGWLRGMVREEVSAAFRAAAEGENPYYASEDEPGGANGLNKQGMGRALGALGRLESQ